MKEHFEDRLLTGSMKVACKYDDGTTRYWQDEKQNVVSNIIRIVTDYARQGYRLTLRQLHYQFVGHVPNYFNHQSAYKKLGQILDDCRYGGVIDWDAIIDRGRTPHIAYSVDGVKGALQDAIDTYRIDRQENQKVAVEVWTEKDALSEILQRSTNKYHVRLCVNKGYTSSSAMYGAYERFIECEKDIVVLYVGDHDPSGLDMIRDCEERLNFMLRNGVRGFYNDITVTPICLNINQVRKYKLPANPTKTTDSRAKDYIKQFGKTCWEVDALSPEVLTSIVETNIENVIDVDLFEEKLKEEEAGKLKLANIIKKIK